MSQTVYKSRTFKSIVFYLRKGQPTKFPTKAKWTKVWDGTKEPRVASKQLKVSFTVTNVYQETTMTKPQCCPSAVS